MVPPLVLPATSGVCAAFPRPGSPLFARTALLGHIMSTCPLMELLIAALLLLGNRFRVRARLSPWWPPFQLHLFVPQPSLWFLLFFPCSWSLTPFRCHLFPLVFLHVLMLPFTLIALPFWRLLRRPTLRLRAPIASLLVLLHLKWSLALCLTIRPR